ncbi:programmed cell death protein 5 [Favolaschia claudopus]|uniref:Programmed cell death protein 5 n=1 Tax=Favolaschia claudopus TaxID=2862362 RepID=A0AAW0C7J8_9AGAR
MFFQSKLSTITVLSCLSLAVIPVARTATIQVTVGGPGVLAYTPDHVQANVGDVIQFAFKQKNHTITRSSLASPCSPLQGEGAFDSGFVPVADDETDFPLAQLTVRDTNPIWIYCRQANHCSANGMVFAVNPGNDFEAFKAAATGSSAASSAGASASATSTSAAPNPSTTSTSADHLVVVGGTAGNIYTPSNITAQPGDTVTFQFHSKNHTVTSSTFANPCSPNGKFSSGFMAVSPDATNFPTFTIQINDTQPIWVYCQQAGHCGQGMVFSVNAVESGPNNFGAFKDKAIQLNGTAAAPSAPPSTDTQNGALLPARSAGVIVALAGVVAGMLL